MGRRGPPKKPTFIRLKQGNPGKLPINKRELKPPKGVPPCPDWLNDDAKDCWKRTIPMLVRLGVLTLLDGNALAGYCDAYAKWKEATEWLNQNGFVFAVRGEPTIEHPKGPIKCMQQWPQVSIAHNCLKVMQNLGAEFGLTPAARARLELPRDSGDEDKFDREYFGPAAAAQAGSEKEEWQN